MRLGMIGLGRMGAAMVERLLEAGHECVVYDRDPEAIQAAAGAEAADSPADLVARLSAPRVVWLMLPAAVVDSAIEELAPHLNPGDVLIDGGNSYYRDDQRRAKQLGPQGIHYLDVGVSGGVRGRQRGYCLMIGGDHEAARDLAPLFASLAPGVDAAPRSIGQVGQPTSAEHGYLHCGPSGAGHFVKMVHNGIEYGLMAAYAEGFNLLAHAGVGHDEQASDAETTPLRDPDAYQYDLDLPAIAELWRRGSVISSWLLDLTTEALQQSETLEEFDGRVSDSGEGRWTLEAAIETATPAPVLSAALFQRFGSRGESLFGDRLLSAMRYRFGGHHERAAQDAAENGEERPS